MIVFILLSGEMPFGGRTDADVARKIKAGKYLDCWLAGNEGMRGPIYIYIYIYIYIHPLKGLYPPFPTNQQ